MGVPIPDVSFSQNDSDSSSRHPVIVTAGSFSGAGFAANSIAAAFGGDLTAGSVTLIDGTLADSPVVFVTGSFDAAGFAGVRGNSAFGCSGLREDVDARDGLNSGAAAGASAVAGASLIVATVGVRAGGWCDAIRADAPMTPMTPTINASRSTAHGMRCWFPDRIDRGVFLAFFSGGGDIFLSEIR